MNREELIQKVAENLKEATTLGEVVNLGAKALKMGGSGTAAAARVTQNVAKIGKATTAAAPGGMVNKAMGWMKANPGKTIAGGTVLGAGAIGAGGYYAGRKSTQG